MKCTISERPSRRGDGFCPSFVRSALRPRPQVRHTRRFPTRCECDNRGIEDWKGVSLPITLSPTCGPTAWCYFGLFWSSAPQTPREIEYPVALWLNGREEHRCSDAQRAKKRIRNVQFHHDIYFDDKRYRAQIWNWLKY